MFKRRVSMISGSSSALERHLRHLHQRGGDLHASIAVAVVLFRGAARAHPRQADVLELLGIIQRGQHVPAGIDQFGASAPAGKVLEEYGFTVEHVAEVVKNLK